MKIHWFIQ